MKKLTKEQKKVLEKLVRSGIIEKNFYLAGGTALTIKYDHRTSEDFDFFSPTFFKKTPHLYLNSLQKIGSLTVDTLTEHTLIFYLDKVKCSFFHYPYKLIKPIKTIQNIPIASDEDIAGMKAIAIIQRGTKKDFFDLWFLMKEHKWDLNKIKEICKNKYGKIFPESAFERAIVYFEDAELTSYPEIDPFWEEVKTFFVKSIKHQQPQRKRTHHNTFPFPSP